MFKTFKEGELFVNRIEAHPKVEFFVNSGSVGLFSYNRMQRNMITSGSTYLGNNLSGSYPFITKDGTLGAFKTVSTSQYAAFNYGDEITGSYPLVASISSDPFVSGQDRPRVEALKNTLDFYTCRYSPQFAFSSSFGDKGTQALRLISIPSIFYGSSIDKGTVSCKFYVSGTLIAELGDPTENGELVQVGPSGSTESGSVAGMVLYREGFIILTGSWDLTAPYTDNFNVFSPATASAPTWRDFFTTGSIVNGTASCCTVPSSSFALEFNGTQHIPTLTMLCHAEKGEFNHSNNPTYVEFGQSDKIPYSSSVQFRERDNIAIKNLVKVPYDEEEPEFEKITYISRIGIFDEEKNLIGVAKVARPVRKKEIDSYTFKLKVDI